MAIREYTAQDMREYADAIAGDLNDNGMASVTYTFNDLLPVIQSLRYAAEVVERCEKLRFNMMPHRRDTEIVDYILHGDAGKEEK